MSAFHEKPLMHDEYVNSGFMVFKKQALDYFDDRMLEDGRIAEEGKPEVLLKNEGSYFYKAYHGVA